MQKKKKVDWLLSVYMSPNRKLQHQEVHYSFYQIYQLWKEKYSFLYPIVYQLAPCHFCMDMVSSCQLVRLEIRQDQYHYQ